ncbi:hypothetical protein [Spirillospora sp. NPDC047279]|uniref:bestrophin-like domain n=1 Tax=Spirillospora sp. NPDC047279 TaxID=3155478 RepID=UPI0033E86342
MTPILVACLAVFGAGATAVPAALLAHRYVPRRARHELGTYGGLVSGIALGLFMLSVGAVAAYALMDLDAGEASTTREASAVTEAYWYAHSVGGQEGLQMRGLLREYVTEVTNVEWPFMATAGDLTDRGWTLVDDLRYRIEIAAPKPQGPAERYSRVLGTMTDIASARRDRQSLAGSYVPAMLWAALITSGLLVAVLPIVRGNPSPVTRATLAFVSTSAVAFVIVIAYQLNGPFQGVISVPPTAFERAAQGFDSIDAHWARHP